MEQEMEKEAPINVNLPILNIDAVATGLKVSKQILINYEKEGILVPYKDSENHRLYSLNDFEKGRLILSLTKNFSLDNSKIKKICESIEKNNIKYDNCLDYIKQSGFLDNTDEK